MVAKEVAPKKRLVEAVSALVVNSPDGGMPSPQPSPKGRGGSSPPSRQGGELLPSPSGRGIKGEGKKALDPELLAFARKLRKEHSDAEQLLWGLLRNRRLDGFKFRRQHPVKPYVLDLYCHEVRLGIELDGGQHGLPDQEARDDKRTAFLAQRGIRILRFWNNDVFKNTEGVLKTIYDALTDFPSSSERGQE